MLHTGSQMLRFWTPALVWLVCGISILHGSKLKPTTASEHDREDDTNNVKCCKECLAPEECEKTATGVCGTQTFNTLHYLCCESTVVKKPAPNAKCCGNKAIDVDRQLCCGQLPNKSIVERNSSDHQCCGRNQFNTKTQCCCMTNATLQIQDPINSSCCVNESGVCGTQSFNTLRYLCCESTVVKKPAPNAKCCGNKAIDVVRQLCCGQLPNKSVVERNSSDHQCCGRNQFNTKTQCCCMTNATLQIQDPINSSCCVNESGVCGTQTFNTLRYLCCESTVVKKPAPNAKCCGNKAIDVDRQLCCGQLPNKSMVERNSSDHQCCGRNQFNTKTQCCCMTNATLQIQDPINSSCCVNESGVCGTQTFNTLRYLCCESTVVKKPAPNAKCCGNNQSDAVPTVHNPCTQVCRGGHVSSIDQIHGSPEQHGCGTERPHVKIYCNGHRLPKQGIMYFCGVRTYNSCSESGVLGHEAQCCGSILKKPKDKTRCCGHLYYYTCCTCCTGNLRAVLQPGHQQKMIKDCIFQSVANLNETDLCKEMVIGTVEKVSLHSIVFSSGVKICGRNASVKPLQLPYTMAAPDNCSYAKLIPGKTYFFSEVNVFTYFNNSLLQSLHFIISKCYR